MKADENANSAFMLVFATFMCCIAAPWTFGLIVSLFCSGIRDEKKKVRKCFLISVALNILLWLLIYAITTSLQSEDWLKTFDPYAVLEIDKNADEKMIKNQYRKLSLKWHPDKNSAPESAQMFFLINKAKEVLTDPVKKENFMMYGNPDGPRGATGISIALPSFLFDPKYQIYVLCAFAFCILVVFPFLVWRWYSNQKGDVDEETGVSVENLNIYMEEVSKKMRDDQIIPMFATSIEFVPLCKLAGEDEASELNILLNQIPKQYKEKYQRHIFLKNIVLIYAHMMNLQMLNKALKTSFNIIRKTIPMQCEYLIGKILEFIILYYQNQIQVLVPINNLYIIIEFQKRFLNRVYSDNGLETFSEEISVDTIELLKSKGNTLKSLESSGERTKVFSRLKINQEEADTINQYYESLPQFKFGEIKAFVKGHENIEEGDIVTVEVPVILQNHENPNVVSNIQRESFNYPGQEERILKTPNLYVLLLEKSGKLLNFSKVPFTKFRIINEETKVKDTVIVSFKLMLTNKGEKKIVAKIINDTYFGIDKNLETEHTIKVDEKKEEVIQKTYDPDAESVDESANSRDEGDDADEEYEEIEEPDKKND